MLVLFCFLTNASSDSDPHAPNVKMQCSILFLPQDQCDHIDKHTQSGLDLLERYIKFVKERTEIEQNYAKQLRCAFLLSSARVSFTFVLTF